MKNTIVWGMIGCGKVTEVKNGPGLYLAENSTLKGVWNRTKEKAESWVERHGCGRVYDSVEELLADPEIDIVYIATTPDQHYDLAIRCAKAGKHALVEKPLAPTLREGQEIREAFAKAGKKCFVCFYRRSMNRFVRLNEILDGGEIGEITGLQIVRAAAPPTDPNAWRMNPEICGGDLFTETDIHALDIMEMIMGPAETFFYTKDKEACSYSLSVKFQSGKIAGGFWNYKARVPIDQFTIFGTEGRIEFDFFHGDQPLKIWSKDTYREEIVEDSKHVGLNMTQEIVNELLGKGHFSGTIDTALETLAIAAKMYFD